MDYQLKELLNNKLVHRNGNNFQKFMDELFKLFYGENYTPIRPQQDKGNDGCLKDKSKIFAIYAPETSKDENKIEKKLQEDLEKYKMHWAKQGYKEFTFIFNNPEFNVKDITARQITLANQCKINFWTRGYLLDNIIGKMTFLNIRKVAVDILQISDEQYTFSIIQWVVDDLTKRQRKVKKIEYESPLGIEEKIIINFKTDEIEIIKDTIKDFYKYFPILKDILQDEETAEILKNKVRDSCLKTESKKPFNERITMMKSTLSRESKDDVYLYYVSCIIFYIFEQCLIGEKVND